jgi:hypothetical protein
MNDSVKTTWKEVVMASFKVLSQHLPDKQGKLQKVSVGTIRFKAEF